MSERTVIIVGKGLTARELPECINRYPDAEVWRLNDDMRYSNRCDRMYQLQELNQNTYTWTMIAGSIYLSRCVEMLLEKQNIQSAYPGFRQPQYRIVKQAPGLSPEVINHNYIIS